MKLAKKMLASVLALAMVAALALTAFAAAPVIKMTATDAVVGKTVTVNVSADQWVGCKSADLEFTYNTDVLEYVSIEEPADRTYKTAEGDLVDNVITWSFYFRDAATATDSTSIATITFKVLKAGDANVSVKATSWDGTDMPAEASVVVKAHEPAVVTTVAPTTAEPTSAKPGVDPTTGKNITQTGEASIAVIAGVMALAAVAFVVTKKKDEE